ncbi:MAG TPA: ABC transporter permease [Gemmatimonadaceae bacterium]|nr:ABC transporter permease [Gemmatimonadaceae bacterium]
MRRLFRLPLRSDAAAAADVDEELHAFLAERVDDLVAQGMSPSEARAEAVRRLGASVDEASASLHTSAAARERSMRVRETLDGMRQDLRYAVRALRRDKAFAAFSIAIVALGIGASATVFSVANGLLLRPLPFANPNRLVWIQNGTEPGLSAQTFQVNPLLSFKRENGSFTDVAAYAAFYGDGDITLSEGSESIRLSAVPVTQNFFPLLGVHPVLGRNFTPEESVWNGPSPVMISHALWERRFASDRAIIGKRITLNGDPTTVVGVLPASFDFGSVFAPGARIDLYTPIPLSPATNRWGNTFAVVGRLAPGATVQSAAAELRVLSPRVTAENPNANKFDGVVSPLAEHVSGRARFGLVVLAFAVGVVMLIVCANLSNLLLARATTRQKEMAIRAALGAGRGRLIRQMLTESLVLSACGAVVGLALAAIGTNAIAHMDAVSLPRLADVTLDARALAFTVLLAAGAGLAFGMVPALQMSEAGVHDTLKASGRAATDSRRSQWMRRGLVVSEIALACVLLVGSGLLVHSFLKVLDVDLGFRPQRVAAVRVDPDQNFKTKDELVSYIDNVLASTRSIPGVSAAAIADGIPLGSNRSWGITPGGQEYRKGHWTSAFIRVASDGYLDAMGMKLVAGRDISPHDVTATEPVVLLNETGAKTLWPGQSALNKLVRLGGNFDRRVVGIVADVRNLSVEQSAGVQAYLPTRQEFSQSTVTLIVRTSLEPASLAGALRRQLASIDPHLATNEIHTLDAAVNRSVSPRKFFTALLGGFTVFALCLALLGIYGVISYTVTHRTQEIGVRMALGATPGVVQARIIRETLRLAVVGVVIGTAGAWIAGQTLSGFLFGVTPADPVTYVAMVCVLFAVAIVSGYVPARRASRIDPVVALREG